MERQDELTLLKPRSYRSVLKAGFKLYTGNFRRLFKASWVMALLYALTYAMWGTLTFTKVPELIVAVAQQIATYHGIIIEPLLPYATGLIGIIVLLLLAAATMMLASATILNKLKEHKETGNITMPASWLKVKPQLMVRTLKGGFISLLLFLVLPYTLILAAVFAAFKSDPQLVQNHSITIQASIHLVTLIIIAFVLPVTYTFMKYLMEAPCGYFRTLTSHYGKGMKHWGGLFLVYFVSSLLLQLLSLFVMMPAYILNYANQTAHFGLLKGDPLGMPSYMTLLMFVTLTLCSFIQFYVSQVLPVHNYYLYGSIEAKEAKIES